MAALDLFAIDQLPTIDPNKDYYSELVGEGLKYKDKEALGRSRIEADIHIARLEDEQKRIRAELATRIDYETFLDQLKTSSLNSQGNPPVEPPKDQNTSLTTEAIERLLEQKLTQREQEMTASQNFNLVDKKLSESWGPNYAQRLKQQAQELGVSEQFIKNVAAANPKALYRLVGIDETPKRDQSFQAPPKNEFSFSGTPSTSKRGFSYYDEMYKKDPKQFFSSKIQNEIFNRTKEIGIDEFNAT